MAAFTAGISVLAVPALAALDQTNRANYMGQTARDIDQWQRVPLRSEQRFSHRASQIKVAIQTRGPSMQGLIRIPGAPASNFDTGPGMTVVDLINVGDETRGYTDIVALEILFTQRALGQSCQVYRVD
ncbi:hypothetical protein ACM43_15785 [Bradyrhizobium sp. CCBAU 45321]|nr:hypothetical protein [Bradyrhizobium sp. CCBAU 45321]